MGVDPADCFDLKPEYCSGNVYAIKTISSKLLSDKIQNGCSCTEWVIPSDPSLPPMNYLVLHGSVLLQKNSTFCCIPENCPILPVVLSALFDKAEKARRTLIERIRISTPDPYFNTLGGALSVAADGIWDGEVWLHGTIGWRMPLSGWRAAYRRCSGWHDQGTKAF